MEKKGEVKGCSECVCTEKDGIVTEVPKVHKLVQPARPAGGEIEEGLARAKANRGDTDDAA